MPFARQRILEAIALAWCVLEIDAQSHIEWLLEQELSRTGGESL